MSAEVESRRNDLLVRAYLFGWEQELDRQVSAGEESDNDKAIAAGNAIERAVRKIIGPSSTPSVPPHE